MAGTKGIRWPEDLAGVVEKAAEEDDRTFSSEVIHLVRLGLKERTIIMAMAEGRHESRLMATKQPPQYGTGHAERA